MVHLYDLHLVLDRMRWIISHPPAMLSTKAVGAISSPLAIASVSNGGGLRGIGKKQRASLHGVVRTAM